MFDKDKEDEMNSADETIAAAWDQLGRIEVESKEYSAGADSLAKLLNAKAAEETAKGKVTPSQAFGLAGTTMLALIGLNYEKLAPITTKAFTFVKSLKQ